MGAYISKEELEKDFRIKIGNINGTEIVTIILSILLAIFFFFS
jgi:hypothetical protein